jgi:hypothetical protein
LTDPITVIGAASAAVTLFDKIADQVERFIKKRPEPDVPHEYRMSIRQDRGDLVATQRGRETQRITGEDLAKLPKPLLDHVVVLEKSMQNHYAVWSSAYPQLALLDSPVQKAKVEAQLGDVIRSMKSDLDGILAFLESAGFHLDDHYLNIRYLVQNY